MDIPCFTFGQMLAILIANLVIFSMLGLWDIIGTYTWRLILIYFIIAFAVPRISPNSGIKCYDVKFWS